MRNLRETERRPLLHAIKDRGIGGLRAFTFLVLAVSWSPVFAEVDRSAYRHSTIDEVVAKVEVAGDGKPAWLIWQRSLVHRFAPSAAMVVLSICTQSWPVLSAEN
jgi:hypothetical protein